MSTAGPRLSDAAARRQAVTDFDTNLAVLAGAGTGKTSLLVERVLIALGSAVAQPAEIAALTFTEKATGEMRTRLTEGLEQLRAQAACGTAGDPATAAARAFIYLTRDQGIDATLIGSRALAGLDQIERIAVKTIHTFCSDLLRAHPLEAGVEPGFQIDPGEQFISLLDDEWARFLAAELGPEATRRELWERILPPRLPMPEIGLVARALAQPHVPEEMLHQKYRPADAGALFGQEAAGHVDAIDELIEAAVTGTTRGILQSLRPVLAALPESGLEGLQQALAADLPLADRIAKDTRPRRTKALSTEEGDLLEATVKGAFSLIRKLAAIDEKLMADLVAAVTPFAVQARQKFLTLGFAGFHDLLVLARDLLRDHPAVRREIHHRYRLLLVDEFQDTDPLQYEIVLYLAAAPDGTCDDEGTAGEAAAGTPPAGDPYSLPLVPGRLFVVGDPKQSIYRFRGADYTAFRQAVQRIEAAGGQALALTTNFRSRAGIIDAVNGLFQEPPGNGSSGFTPWRSSDYQPPYTPIQAFREAAIQPQVEIWSADLPPETRATERRLAEGKIVAREIHRMVAEGHCEYRHITILFRTYAQFAPFLRALRRQKVPFIVDGGTDFLQRPEVGQLMAALRTLLRPADALSLLAFLRSPAGAVADAELAAHAAAGGRWQWKRGELPDAARFPGVARAWGKLRQIADEIRELPADAVIAHVLERIGIVPLGAAAYEGPQRVANVRKLATTLTDAVQDGRMTILEALDSVEQKPSADLEGDSPLADEATNAVHVMTIHKAKGLESKVIFMPDLARLDRRPPERPGAGPVSVDGAQGLRVKTQKASNTAHVWFEREKDRHNAAEEMRVFYVGLTRARDRLVLLAGPSRRDAPWLDFLEAWGFVARERPDRDQPLDDGRVLFRAMQVEEKQVPTQPVAEQPTSPAVEAYALAHQRLLAAASPPFRTPSGVEEEAGEQRERHGDGRPRRGEPRRDGHGREVGIVCHRLLETWDGGAELLAPVTAEAERVVRENGAIATTAVATIAGRAREVLQQFLASPLAARFRQVDRLAAEMPLLVRGEDGSVWRGSIDLLYRDGDGSVVIADYKTDAEADAGALARRYAPQLAVYVSATGRALGLELPPRAEIWHLPSGGLFPVDVREAMTGLKLSPPGQ